MATKVGLPPPAEMEALVIDEVKRQIAAHEREAEGAAVLLMQAQGQQTSYSLALREYQAKVEEWTELVHYWQRVSAHHFDMIRRLRNIKRQPRRDRKPVKKDRKEQ